MHVGMKGVRLGFSHQDVGVEPAVSLSQGLVEPAEIGKVISFIQETGIAVVSSPRDVQSEIVEGGMRAT